MNTEKNSYVPFAGSAYRSNMRLLYLCTSKIFKPKIFTDITMPAKLFVAQILVRYVKIDFGHKSSIF